MNIRQGRCGLHLVLVVDVDLVAAAAVAKALLVGVVVGQVLKRFSTVNLMPKPANLVVCAPAHPSASACRLMKLAFVCQDLTQLMK